MNSYSREKISEADTVLLKSVNAEIYKILKDEHYNGRGYVANKTVISLLNEPNVKVCVINHDDDIIESNF